MFLFVLNRKAFRDAVAEAGTLPALTSIIRWIHSNKLAEAEAAEIVAALPRSAITPTPDYIKSFFVSTENRFNILYFLPSNEISISINEGKFPTQQVSPTFLRRNLLNGVRYCVSSFDALFETVFICFQELAEDPKIKKQSSLNSTVILSFATLLRKVAVDSESAHNNYPVHISRRMVPKRFPPMTKYYIPYLNMSLEKAIHEGDSEKIQVYIRALGNTGHPSILQIFEPYLEGQKNVSKFQRLLMVSALDKVASLYPKIARPALYNLYQNTAESHKVRSVAVILLMKTNPPLVMLQRMAEFTNIDPHQQVISAVQSAIKSAAALEDPLNFEL
jgi:hypothetical protein